MSFDFSDIERLAADLDRAVRGLPSDATKVVTKAAMNVKDQLRAEAAGVEHAPGFPAAISFDVRSGRDETTAEIGPESGGAGSLALLYLGNSKTGPRLPDPMLAVLREVPVMERHLADAAVKALDG